jgi:hypothetical protein
MACISEKITYNILIWTHKRKRPLGKSSRTLKDNIKMDLKYKSYMWTAFIYFG